MNSGGRPAPHTPLALPGAPAGGARCNRPAGGPETGPRGRFQGMLGAILFFGMKLLREHSSDPSRTF